jgi:putative flippase GtrA
MKSTQSQLFRFALVGVSNTVLSLVAIWCALKVLRQPDMVANVVGYAVGFIWSFIWNRNWTFGHRGSISVGFIRVVLVYGVAYCVNLAVLSALVAHVGAGTLWAQLPGMVAYTAVCFLGLKFVAFTPPHAATGR